MKNNYLGNYETFNKAAMGSAKELETISAKVIGQLAQKNIDLFNSAIEMNSKFVSLFGESKGIQELLTGQLKLTGEYNEKLNATIKEAAEIVAGSKDDYQSWLKDGLQTVSATAQTVAPTEETSTKQAA